MCELNREKRKKLANESEDLLHVGSEAQETTVKNEIVSLQKAAVVFWMMMCTHVDGKAEVRIRSIADFMAFMLTLFRDDVENPAYKNILTLESSAKDLRQPHPDRCMYNLFKAGKMYFLASHKRFLLRFRFF